jgi:hypothetical protein
MYFRIAWGIQNEMFDPVGELVLLYPSAGVQLRDKGPVRRE